MIDKGNTPFTPGYPVPVELFSGRSEQIKEVLQFVKNSLSGKQENIFLIGDRGIGKSSFASYIRHIVNTNYNVLGIHVFLGGSSTLDEMVHRIFEQLLRETKDNEWFGKIKEFFGDYVEKVDLFGISVKFSPPKEKLTDLVGKFSEALLNLIQKIKDDKRGLFIVLDDINGLAKKKEFADWYKSFVDEVATHYKEFPVSIILTAIPEIRDSLYHLQPSLNRIFRIIEIEKLTDDEVTNFFNKSFNNVNMKVEDEAMYFMVKYSSGLPILMHEIGDAVFSLDDDNIISELDSLNGLIYAAQRIGSKYLEPTVYRAIRSEHYKSILRKLSEIQISQYFMKKEIEEKLTEKEKKVFNNFLIKLKKLGIIEKDLDKPKGAYKFVNAIYPLYINIESVKYHKLKDRN